MNSFNPRRVSYLRPPTIIIEARESWASSESTYPSLSDIGYPPSILSKTTKDDRFSSSVWNRTFNHVDYASYKAACEAERTAQPTRNPDVFESTPDATRRGFSRLGAMLTIYPYRDMGWLATMVFIMAAISFTLNGIFSLVHLLDRRMDFPGRETGTQVTFTLGSALLTLSAFMGLQAAFNVDRGVLDPKKDAPNAYKPALLGSEDWVSWPSWWEFKNVFWPNSAFRAGILQLLAGSFFTLAAVATIPGVLDLSHPDAFILFVSAPQLLGGSFFVLAGLLMVYLSQDGLVPKILDASWQNGLWNLIGAIGFLAVGIVAVRTKDSMALSIGWLLVASGVGFLVAGVIQWYIIMEYYPVDPYWKDPTRAAEVPQQSIY